MPAINFQKRFADAVESGAKRQTIRAPRADGRPNATVGAVLYLYTGMRSRKGCRKLGEAICTRTAQVFITDRRLVHVDGSLLMTPVTEDEFARRDGFADMAAMLDWFEETHGLPFEGSLIEWERLS